MMQEDQKGCKNVSQIRAEEEQVTAIRVKHEDEEDAGKRTKKTRQKKKPTVLNKNVQDQKACKNIRTEEEQTTTVRTKHEDEEEDTGTRPAWREI